MQPATENNTKTTSTLTFSSLVGELYVNYSY